ncbi:hypothetical protein [Streptomyces sp. NBC_01304]|uniref:hypothetical protein n=1 Tax=Streptomyces sp. NBC_01304 TaxID=2903818 RepID=UPI002E159FE6|nr:glycosyltransferase [Streptomyces sp. NBC_01304]
MNSRPVPAAAILPSRNEPDTIAAVTTAVDDALDHPGALIINADSSDHPATAQQFAQTPTRARKISLTGLPRGKGAQILAALDRLPVSDGPLLIADTDTRTPDPRIYRALARAAEPGCAIADYPRYWDEANLTSHLARPLIAATTGWDVPQPLAGDLALAPSTLDILRAAARGLSADLRSSVNGYGIDAFLLLTAAHAGRITSVPLTTPKQHAASFPHLTDIYHQAVPVLLALTARWTPPPASPTARYRTTDRELTGERLEFMHQVLDQLASGPAGSDMESWPRHLAEAWHAVRNGTPPHQAAAILWPHYIHRVRGWLTPHRSPAQRAAELTATHARLADHLAARPVWSPHP